MRRGPLLLSLAGTVTLVACQAIELAPRPGVEQIQVVSIHGGVKLAWSAPSASVIAPRICWSLSVPIVPLHCKQATSSPMVITSRGDGLAPSDVQRFALFSGDGDSPISGVVAAAPLERVLADAQLQFTVHGTNAQAGFGNSIAIVPFLAAGDVADLVVSAPGERNQAGAVYVFGPSMVPRKVFRGQPGDRLGERIAVGDFDGDGRPDLAAFGYTLTGVGWNGPPAAYLWLQPPRRRRGRK